MPPLVFYPHLSSASKHILPLHVPFSQPVFCLHMSSASSNLSNLFSALISLSSSSTHLPPHVFCLQLSSASVYLMPPPGFFFHPYFTSSYLLPPPVFCYKYSASAYLLSLQVAGNVTGTRIHFHVMDKDTISSDDFVGQASVKLTSGQLNGVLLSLALKTKGECDSSDCEED